MPEVDEGEAWRALAAHHVRTGGMAGQQLATLPDYLEAVRAEVPGLTRARFHDLLGVLHDYSFA